MMMSKKCGCVNYIILALEGGYRYSINGVKYAAQTNPKQLGGFTT